MFRRDSAFTIVTMTAALEETTVSYEELLALENDFEDLETEMSMFYPDDRTYPRNMLVKSMLADKVYTYSLLPKSSSTLHTKPSSLRKAPEADRKYTKLLATRCRTGATRD